MRGRNNSMWPRHPEAKTTTHEREASFETSNLRLDVTPRPARFSHGVWGICASSIRLAVLYESCRAQPPVDGPPVLLTKFCEGLQLFTRVATIELRGGLTNQECKKIRKIECTHHRKFPEITTEMARRLPTTVAHPVARTWMGHPPYSSAQVRCAYNTTVTGLTRQSTKPQALGGAGRYGDLGHPHWMDPAHHAPLCGALAFRGLPVVSPCPVQCRTKLSVDAQKVASDSSCGQANKSVSCPPHATSLI